MMILYIWRYENFDFRGPILYHFGKQIKLHFRICHNTPITISIFVTIVKWTGNNSISPTFYKSRNIMIYIIISYCKNNFLCPNRFFTIRCNYKYSIFFFVDIYYFFFAKFSRIVFVNLLPCDLTNIYW